MGKNVLMLIGISRKSDGNNNSGQSHTSINFMVIDLEYFASKKIRNSYEEKKTYLMGENYPHVPLYK